MKARKQWLYAIHTIRRSFRDAPMRLVGSCTLIIALLLPFTVARPVAAAPIPTGLPGHFMLGLANSPGDQQWMQSSGIPWDARYQYLSGGVNTGGGWATWNPNGDFATYYMQGSSALGAVPVFTYYQLLQSTPSSGSNEAEKNYNNLNNAATMQAYYAEWKLLMDKIRAFNKPVVVHVEPDLFGYMQQRVVGSTNSAASVPAAVASSGYGDVQGLPNTFQGFNQALLRLRDLYAPNAILAMHISAWTTGTDIGSSTDPNLNVALEAQKTVAFHKTAGLVGNPSGMSSYDLLFFDPLDRDAAFYEYQYGDRSRWWDESNQRFPNFNRYHAYVKAVTTSVDRRAMLWQVPIGNTKYRSVNNTWDHYQDNRVQYWLGNYPADGHLQALADAGVIGILFGRGAGGPTTYTDAAGDGITNPAPINGNNAVAQYADDDGGYLRLMSQQYYQKGVYRFNGGSAPTATRTAAPSATRTAIATATRSIPPTATRTAVSTATRTALPSVTRTATATRTPVAPRSPTPTRTPSTRIALPLFMDGLSAGWADWSWMPLTRNLANTSPVFAGNASIAVTYTGGWSGFQVGRNTALSLAGYDVLRFRIRGNTGAGQIEVRIGNANASVRQVVTPSTAWTQVEVPLGSLTPTEATYVWWQNITGNAQPTFYLDNIEFIDK